MFCVCFVDLKPETPSTFLSDSNVKFVKPLSQASNQQNKHKTTTFNIFFIFCGSKRTTTKLQELVASFIPGSYVPRALLGSAKESYVAKENVKKYKSIKLVGRIRKM